jgi:hypothetical protein
MTCDMRLVLIALDMVEAILAGRQATEVTLVQAHRVFPRT